MVWWSDGLDSGGLVVSYSVVVESMIWVDSTVLILQPVSLSFDIVFCGDDFISQSPTPTIHIPSRPPHLTSHVSRLKSRVSAFSSHPE